MKTIEITISPEGESTIKTSGFAGSSCRDASRFIEQALGDKVSETLTSEFYLSSISTDQNVEQK